MAKALYFHLVSPLYLIGILITGLKVVSLRHRSNQARQHTDHDRNRSEPYKDRSGYDDVIVPSLGQLMLIRRYAMQDASRIMMNRRRGSGWRM